MKLPGFIDANLYPVDYKTALAEFENFERTLRHSVPFLHSSGFYLKKVLNTKISRSSPFSARSFYKFANDLNIAEYRLRAMPPCEL